MDADVYSIDGGKRGALALPGVFSSEYRQDLIQRALLSEQSRKLQPQGHFVLAGLQTTAVYVGKYSGYRRGRHMGIAIRPRQKLGGGAMGDVRRIPSSVKGKRAHPHLIEKRLVEAINKREYLAALRSAIAGCTDNPSIRKLHNIKKDQPLIVENEIEGIEKTKELVKLLSSLGFSADLEGSRKPRLSNGRGSRRRRFRKSVLIVAGSTEKLARAGRNIPGVDVTDLASLSIELLAPGTLPRPSIWSRSAIEGLENVLKEVM